MGRPVRYHPLFDRDVQEAARWYDQRSAGLGDAFVEVVRQRTGDVIADPERFGRSPTGCRYIRLPRFPYVLLFDLVEDELLMLGVLHTARSMEKWRERQ
ncbi:MAG: type II toxin-antitoxin system RelE/ParE family toxin [Candidatus Nealsonbacteria bacterium]|nr:type II toxin-antitoxin system RelE/ParE family toxin [Candidatus Nealsonbacteria bacterium]